MHFDERNVGDYRVYAGALEAQGGYLAAVVISRIRGLPDVPREAYRDTAMSGGHRFEKPDEALSFAVSRASEVIRQEPEKLGC
jgi:hypothetical protein